jgi:hypothetical protein
VFSWRENEAAQDDGQAGALLGAKTSSREQGPDFDLVGTSPKDVICETPGPCIQCVDQVLSRMVCINLIRHGTRGYG